MHGDLIFKRLFYNHAEEEMGRFFRNRLRDTGDGAPTTTPEAEEDQPDEPRGNKSRKKGTPKLGRDRIACNLLGKNYEDVSDWTAFYGTENIPWRRIYTEYIVPLARLCRLLHRSFTTRSFDSHLFAAAKRYTEGCRVVFGKDWMTSKGLWHRLFHVIAQAVGKRVANSAAKPSALSSRLDSMSTQLGNASV